ncbi:response regulator transcription factor [Paraburkholderia rhynchosiae]|uniref:response regulator transcription factor n=1 Tax=Paraburkholderia rhynchosiae TaxID=487049 RepID=UPI001304F86E|nr:response regulator transcription factor [Paraburkholderia rhynchosiae]
MDNDLLFAIATDDRMLRRNLAESLAGDGIVVESFSCELDLLRAMRVNRYDLVLIDSKTEPTATSALLSWRSCNADVCTPLIVLTNQSSWTSLLRWIDTGATDVVNRYDMEQIRFRAHLALQRRVCNTMTHEIQIGRYRLQKDTSRATIDGVDIPLTAREFAIAWLFFSNPGKFFSRAQIAASIWGATEQIAARTLEQHIYKLRKKLDLSRTAELSLKTVYALGYKLHVAQAAQSELDASVEPGFAALEGCLDRRGVREADYLRGAERMLLAPALSRGRLRGDELVADGV